MFFFWYSLPLSILNARVEIKKSSFVFAVTTIIFHPDKQVALIKLANLSSLKILKPIKLSKKVPKENKEVLVYRMHHSKSVWQYTKIASISNKIENESTISGNICQNPKTDLEQFITIATALKNQGELKGSPVVYKNRLVGLLQPYQFNKSGEMVILNILYYLEWIKSNTDYKQK